MKLWLHIGTDKAGSTALQTHLASNRDWLQRQGVYLPLTGLGPDNGHAALFSAATQVPLDSLRAELAAEYEAVSIELEHSGAFELEFIGFELQESE